MKKIYFIIAPLFITILSFGQITSPGDLAFVGFNADGDDDFAIVALVNISPNTMIYFTDNEPNAAGNGVFDTNEGTIKWDTGGSTILAGTVVNFTDTDSSSNSLFAASIGTISYVESSLNLSGSGDALFATLGDPITNNTTVWLAGIQNASGFESTNFSATGLTIGTTFIDFHDPGGNSDPDRGVYSGVSTGLENWSDYLPYLGSYGNWTRENTDGESLLPFASNGGISLLVLPVGKNEIEGFSVYPNPVTNGNFRISSAKGISKKIEVYDMLGKQMLSKQIRQNETIRVDNLNPGIYILKVEEEGKTATRKLVIE